MITNYEKIKNILETGLYKGVRVEYEDNNPEINNVSLIYDINDLDVWAENNKDRTDIVSITAIPGSYHQKVLLICKAMGHTTYIVRIGDVLEYMIKNNQKEIDDFIEYYALNYRPFLSQSIPLYPEEQREPLIDYLLTLIPQEVCQTQ